MNTQQIPVPQESAGQRVDVFLYAIRIRHSRAAVQRLIEQGAVRIQGLPVKASLRLRGGELLEVDSDEESISSADLLSPWNFPLPVLYEEESFLAIEKPAGIVTHPGAGTRDETLANALVHLRPQLAGVGHPLRPGIVHRLDKETSGLMLIAKTEEAYQALSRMFKDREVEKHYRALAFGMFERKNGRIDKALGRDPNDRKKISVRARHSRNAVTLFRVMQQYGCAALLDVQILTGRTHQIRVHLSSENHPIVGDSRYGGANWMRIPDPNCAPTSSAGNSSGCTPSPSTSCIHSQKRPCISKAPYPPTGLPVCKSTLWAAWKRASYAIPVLDRHPDREFPAGAAALPEHFADSRGCGSMWRIGLASSRLTRHPLPEVRHFRVFLLPLFQACKRGILIRRIRDHQEWHFHSWFLGCWTWRAKEPRAALPLPFCESAGAMARRRGRQLRPLLRVRAVLRANQAQRPCLRGGPPFRRSASGAVSTVKSAGSQSGTSCQ